MRPVLEGPTIAEVPHSYGDAIPEPEGLTSIETTFPVLLSIKRSFGAPQDTVPVDWPVNWRLPQQGDSIHVRNDWGGIVQSVDFDLGSGLVILHLR